MTSARYVGGASCRYIDGHCHLADPTIEAELPRILADAEAAGIGVFVQGGVDPRDWQRQAQLKAKFPSRIVTAYGLHPWWAATHPKEQIQEALLELDRRIEEADALGELGLDYAPRFAESTRENQAFAFEHQIELSRKWPSKPIVLHVVRAHEPALAALKAAGRAGRSNDRGLVHSFSASREIAQQYLDLGFILSVSGVITRKGFETLRRAVRYIPGDRLVLETDSPDQAPEGWERPWNEPLSLFRTADAIAEIRGEKASELLERSARNLRRMFGMKPSEE